MGYAKDRLQLWQTQRPGGIIATMTTVPASARSTPQTSHQTLASTLPPALLEPAAADWQRPVFHFAPPACWLNDPNGTITLDGWHHLFYQFCPDRDTDGPKHWGHARSRDLVDWEHLPVALSPDPSINEHGVWSGGAALAADGTPVLVYTSFPHADASGQRRFHQVVVTCDRELTQFTRLPGKPLATDANLAYRNDSRDPFLFTAEGKTWMVHGTVRDNHSVILLHEAANDALTEWRFVGEMVRWPCGLVPFPECPNMLHLGGDRWMLLLSPYGPVEGFVGTFSNGLFTVDREVRLDLHDSFYATNVLDGADGKPVLMTWARHWPTERGWNGCCAAPRRVVEDTRMGIRQEILPAWLAGLAEGAAQHWKGSLRNSLYELDAEAGDQLLVDLKMEREPGASVLCEIGRASDGSNHSIAWRGDRLVIAGHASILQGVGEVLDLRIVVDRGLIEVFADGGRTVVTRTNQRRSRGAGLRITTAGAVHIEAEWQKLRAAVFTG
jgi:sucrose-6-phosphate hydrolase SacC (GH32 family)